MNPQFLHVLGFLRLSEIPCILYISKLFSKIVSWKPPGIAASFSILSRISARLRREMSSFAANEVSRVASCLLSSSNLLAVVAFVVGRGSQGVVEKYAGQLVHLETLMEQHLSSNIFGTVVSPSLLLP